MSTKGKTGATQATLVCAVIGIAYATIPLVFGQRIEVSPFLLFGIVAVCNVAQGLVPAPAVTTPHTALRLFCTRLAVSAVLSGLLVVIYRVARTLG